ncbi:MAG: InlB B-repeat-containing protein, partial [Oceanipulchritudo sp.]
PATNGVDFSSPQIFLLAGETYTLEVGCKLGSTTGSLSFGFLASTEPGYPTDTTGAQTFTVPAGPDWSVQEVTFTVPEDGAYYLTLFEPSLSGYIKAWFDDIRLIGNFNSVPSVALTNPSGPVRTIAGADLLLEAEASDIDGTVEEVSFRNADGTLLAPDAVDTTEPFAYNWLDVPEGEYNILARAFDDGSAVFDSTARGVEVVPNNLSISTYLGGSDTDEDITGATYLSDGTLVLGGILDPALFPGVTPLYLNGSTTGDRGIVARLSEDGTSILGVTVVGAAVHDLDVGANGEIHVAAATDGAVVLNSSADTVLWSGSYGAKPAHRIDAADDGTFAVMTSEVDDYLETKQTGTQTYVYDSAYNELGQLAGAAAFNTDIAVDAASQTVILIGWKNVSAMEDDSSAGANPVDIPAMVGRAYDGTLKWRGYDWEKQASGDRWLNLYTNNMADTRGARVIVRNGKLYAAFEFDGGNTPLRFSPFDLAVEVPIVGGDKYHQMWGTSTVPKTFLGIYEPATGIYENGQWITNRELDDSDNMIRMRNGGLDVDAGGRVHLVGSAAYGLPLSHDPFPGIYTGGAFHLVYSPDLTSREFVTRLSYRGLTSAVAASPNGKIATAGRITDADSDSLFLHNPIQSTASTGEDAWLAVGDYAEYYKFQPADHPRLYFDDAGLQAVRGKLDREPFSSIYAKFIEQIDTQDFFRPYDPQNANSLLERARGLAIHYALSGDEALATQTRQEIEAALALIDAEENWANPSVKGLDSYHYARDLAVCYDLCVDAEAWDPPFDYAMSARLLSIATMIVEDGGTEQPNDPGSNWRGNRGASAGLALLATDHQYDPTLLEQAHGMVLQYLDHNQAGANGHGWNPEGFNYTAYSIGNHVGHYALATVQAGPEWSLRGDERLKWMAWTGFAGATSAYDIFGFGGVKTDWSDENPHIGGEGIYGLSFFFADDALLPGLRYAYDRLMGELSPYGPTWDAVRQGALFSLMFYPEDVEPVDPTEIWEWHCASDDSEGLGLFTFRNAYQDSNDSLVQFKTRQYALPQAHDGPDGLGLRVISHGDAFVVGGGRDSDDKDRNQATVYPSDPDTVTSWDRNKTGSVVGTPLIKPDGGGHVIGTMAESNLGTTNHKRWLVTDFDRAATGADTTLIVADTSDNGFYWQLPTFVKNGITTSGNTFTITGTNGATLRGTILHPGGTPQITVGTKQRGSHYGLENGGTLATEDPVTNPRIQENRYLYIQGGDGDFLVVMTIVDPGESHPAVSHLSGTVADATVQVGARTYTLQSDDVLYDGAVYTHPDATVTFDADGKGTLGGAPVQTVAYGASAIAPVVSPYAGYTFLGWNKAFEKVVKSMTVTALYDAMANDFTAWIADSLYGLSGSDRDPGADPDSDGIANLLEYAFVLNPSLPDGNGVLNIREDNGQLILEYRVRDDAADITVTPMWSTTMATGSWSAVPAANISVTGSGANYTEYEASMSMGSGPLFLRIAVE